MRSVTRTGACGLAAAVAFAAALAILAAASRAPAAEAQAPIPAADSTTEAYTEPGRAPDDGDDSNDIAWFSTPTPAPEKRAGGRVYLRVVDLGPGDGRADRPDTAATSTLFRFSVDTISTAAASFRPGGQTLYCADNRACDLDPEADRLLVRLDIADGAQDNTRVIVNLRNLNDRRETRFVIPVIGDRLAASNLRVELESGSSASRPARGTAGNPAHEAVFRVTLEDNQSPPAGLAGRELVVTTSNGVLRSSGFGANCPASGVTRCELTTRSGGGRIHLRGSGQPGSARLTFRAAGFTVTRDVDFYGAAARITAAAEQGSVELGGSVFVVVTVTDAAGNGVPGRTPARGRGGDAVQGPRPGAVTVRAAANVAKDVSGTAGDIPACSAGTDGAGRCVMLVTAPNPAGAANDAARGTHTLTVVGASPIPAAAHKVTVDIDVAGPAERVSTDAPGRVEPGSSTDITATVTDDRGVRAGAQSVTVTRIAGGGRLVNAGPATTRDGQHTFTYRADARAGAAEFLVEVRALDGDGNAAGRVLARTRLAIRVGAGAAAALPTLTPAPSGRGFTITFFSGGPVSGLGAALRASCSDDRVAAWAYRPDGFGFVSYVPNARVAAVNAPFRAQFPAGLPANTGLIIGRCDR